MAMGRCINIDPHIFSWQQRDQLTQFIGSSSFSVTTICTSFPSSVLTSSWNTIAIYHRVYAFQTKFSSISSIQSKTANIFTISDKGIFFCTVSMERFSCVNSEQWHKVFFHYQKVQIKLLSRLSIVPNDCRLSQRFNNAIVPYPQTRFAGGNFLWNDICNCSAFGMKPYVYAIDFHVRKDFFRFIDDWMIHESSSILEASSISICTVEDRHLGQVFFSNRCLLPQNSHSDDMVVDQIFDQYIAAATDASTISEKISSGQCI